MSAPWKWEAAMSFMAISQPGGFVWKDLRLPKADIWAACLFGLTRSRNVNILQITSKDQGLSLNFSHMFSVVPSLYWLRTANLLMHAAVKFPLPAKNYPPVTDKPRL